VIAQIAAISAMAFQGSCLPALRPSSAKNIQFSTLSHTFVHYDPACLTVFGMGKSTTCHL
jgi:hypothetical protein